MDNIRVLKLITGEEIIAEIISNNEVIEVEYPILVNHVFHEGEFLTTLIKWIGFAIESKYTFNPNHVICVSDISQDLKNSYLKVVEKEKEYVVCKGEFNDAPSELKIATPIDKKFVN